MPDPADVVLGICFLDDGQYFWMAIQRYILRMHIKRAKPASERFMTFQAQILITKEDYVMIKKRLVNLAEGRSITIREVYA